MNTDSCGPDELLIKKFFERINELKKIHNGGPSLEELNCYVDIAEVYLRENEKEAAFQALDKAFLNYAYLENMTPRDNQALARRLENILGTDDNHSAHKILGFLLKEMGEHERALDHFKTGHDIEPNLPNSNGKSRYAILPMILLEAMAECHHRLGDTQSAIDCFRESYNIVPDEAVLQKIDVLKQHATEKEELEMADPLDPRIVGAMHLASEYMNKGDWVNAIAKFGEVLSTISDFIPAHYGLAHAYYRSDNFDAALSEINKTLELLPEGEVDRWPDIYFIGANIYVQKGEQARADEFVKKGAMASEKAGKEMWKAYFDFAANCARNNKMTDAERCLKVAHGLVSDSETRQTLAFYLKDPSMLLDSE